MVVHSAKRAQHSNDLQLHRRLILPKNVTERGNNHFQRQRLKNSRFLAESWPKTVALFSLIFLWWSCSPLHCTGFPFPESSRHITFPRKGSLPRSRFLDVTLRDIQNTAARETSEKVNPVDPRWPHVNFFFFVSILLQPSTLSRCKKKSLFNPKSESNTLGKMAVPNIEKREKLSLFKHTVTSLLFNFFHNPFRISDLNHRSTPFKYLFQVSIFHRRSILDFFRTLFKTSFTETMEREGLRRLRWGGGVGARPWKLLKPHFPFGTIILVDFVQFYCYIYFNSRLLNQPFASLRHCIIYYTIQHHGLNPRSAHTYATASHRRSSHCNARISSRNKSDRWSFGQRVHNKRLVLLTTHIEQQHISPTEQCSSSLQ